MSSSIGSVKIALEAVDNVSGVMDQVKGSLSGLSGIATTVGQNIGAFSRILGDIGGPFKGVSDIVGGFATGGPAGAGIAAIGECVGFLKESVQAAGDSERVMATLRQTVENQGTAWGNVKDAVEGTLKGMQSTSRFSDEELAKSLGTLVSHGMDVKTAMGALQTAMDTAVGAGMPLNEVATAIGKAYEGQDTALTRLVPAIGDMAKNMGQGATDADKFQGALKILSERYGGQALTDAQTFAGTQERMANAWNDFQETVGKAVLPALTDLLNAFMKIGKEAIGPLMDSLGELWSALFGDDVDLKGFGEFVTNNIIVILKETARFIREDVVPVVKAFHEAFQTASDLIGPPLKAMSTAIDSFLGALKTAFQGFYDWLVGASLWTEMWNQMTTIAGQMIGQLISDLGSKLFEPMKTAFTSAIDAIKDLWGKGWDAIQTAAKTVWDAVTTSVGPWIDDIKTTIGTTLDGLKTGWETTWNGIQTGAQTVWDTIARNVTPWIDGVKKKVTDATDALKTAWDTTWAGVKTTLDTLLPQVQTFLNTKFDEMKAYVETSSATYGPTMSTAIGIMQSAMNTGMALVKGDWQGALDGVKAVLDGVIALMEGAWSGFQGAMDTAIGVFKGAISGAASSLDTTLAGMQSAANTALGTIQGILSSAWGAITGATTAASTAVSTITSSSNLGVMPASTLSPGVIGAQINEPGYVYNPATSTTPGCPPGSYWNGSACVPLGTTVMSTPPPSPSTLNATIPVTVQVDSQTVSTVVQKNLVSSIDYRGKR